MIRETPSMSEILEYLQTVNFQENYVCGDDTFCDMFARRTIPALVGAQSHVTPEGPRRAWWIEFVEAENKFVLRLSYFDKWGNPITRQEFLNTLQILVPTNKYEKIPAVAYTPEAKIEWIQTAPNEYTATYSVTTPTSGCMIAGALSKIKRKI